MNERVVAFRATIAALPEERARLRACLPQLHALYRDLVRAYAPPNPQFERERIIAQTPLPRELVFLLGLLSEGENEAALLLDLIDAVATADPNAPVEHLVDEAWYYLRTSIDENWQLDEGVPCASAALTYLYIILSDRLVGLEHAPRPAAFADVIAPEHARLLSSLRDALTRA